MDVAQARGQDVLEAFLGLVGVKPDFTLSSLPYVVGLYAPEEYGAFLMAGS